MANVKMQDAYYLEKILKGTGSIIIIANDNTTSYLLFFLSVAIRWVSETGYYNFINSFLILAVLLLLFTAPVLISLISGDDEHVFHWKYLLSKKNSVPQQSSPTLP